MTRLLLCAVLALACAFPVSAATLPATPATFIATVSSAAPGDVVELAPGDYGSPIIEAKSFAAPGITLQGAPGVTVKTLTIKHHWQGAPSEGITVSKLRVRDIIVTGSHRIAVVDSELGGTSMADRAGGLWVRNSTHLEVTGNRVRYVGNGLSFLSSSQVTVARNEVSHIGEDAIRIAADKNGPMADVLVADNYLHTFFPGPTTHPDAIQSWNGFSVPAKNIRILRNHIAYGQGSGIPPQGIFHVDGKYEDVLIEGNGLDGTLWNGITVSGGRNVTIRDNIAVGRDTAEKITSRIRTVANDNILIEDNITNSIIHPTTATNPADVGLVERNNTIVPLADGAAAFAAWAKTHSFGLSVAPVPVPVDPKDAEIVALRAQVAGLTVDLVRASAQAVTLGGELVEVKTELAAANDNIAISATALDAERRKVAGLKDVLRSVSAGASAVAKAALDASL